MDEDTSTPNSPEPHEQAEQIILGALVKSRAEEAYEMKLAGKPLREIADELGYDDTSEVSRAINSQMKMGAEFMSVEERSGILQIELDRLDRLHEKLWPSAMMADLKSVEAVLHIHDRRMKAAQMDKTDTATQQHTVLVVGGQEADYIKTLKELSDG